MRYFYRAPILCFPREEACDKTKCPGPLIYYDSIGCKPVYDNEGDCCATKYDCDHLNQRAKDKCYVNGKEYAIGEKLKDEDANPCDIGCVCRTGYEEQYVRGLNSRTTPTRDY